jgi:hypothetical protein
MHVAGPARLQVRNLATVGLLPNVEEQTHIDVITSGLPTTRELNEDLYLRRSYLTLFLNGTGYQESKLVS